MLAYDGQTFRTRVELAKYLAPIVQRTAACEQMLGKLENDGERVVAHYRTLDEAGGTGELAIARNRSSDRRWRR